MSITPSSSDDRHPLERLAEEFVERHRRGEHPPLSDYTEKHPDLAEEIRDLFPALVLVEKFKPATQDLDGPVSPAPHNIPERLGDFRIIRFVGGGGMGDVYEAEQESMRRHVALKILKRELLCKKSLTRFRRESRAAGRLHHTNIVPVFGLGECDGIHFYAMQFIRGESLDKVIQDLRRFEEVEVRQPPSEGPLAPQRKIVSDLSMSLRIGTFSTPETLPTLSPALEALALSPTVTATATADAPPDPPVAIHGQAVAPGQPAEHPGSRSHLGVPSEKPYYREVARIGVQVAEALAYTHHLGIIHRDIKPSNLLLDLKGVVWVADFGLVKDRSDPDQSHGEIPGTIRFMGPELFEGKPTPQSDIYSLGLTLYELLTLRPAFEADDNGQLIRKVLHEKPRDPRQVDPGIPRDLETIVLKAIDKDLRHRFETAGELARELRNYLEGRPLGFQRSAWYENFWRWCKRNPALAGANIAAVVLTTILAIGGLVAATTYRRQRNEVVIEQGKTKASLGRAEQAERRTRLALGEALLSEGVALQRTGLVGQRFESLDRLTRAARAMREEPNGRNRLPEIRDHAITALGLTDVRVSWQQRKTDLLSITLDKQLEHQAVVERRSGETVVRRLDDGRELVRLPHPGMSFWSAGADFSPDGQYMAMCYETTGENSIIDVWHTGRWERILRQLPPSGATAFHPDGRRFVFVSPEKDLVLWNLVERREERRLPLAFVPSRMRLDPGGRRIAFNSSNGPPRLHILDLDSGRVLASWTDQVGNTAISWSHDGRLLTVGDWDGGVFVRDASSGRLVSVLQGHSNAVMGGEFSPEGHLLATHGWDATVRLWNAATGDPLVSISSGFLGFSRDGRRIALYDGDNLSVCDVAHGQDVRSLNPLLIGNRSENTRSRVEDARFSPEGRLMALAHVDGVHLYDGAGGRQLAHLKTGPCETVLFDPAGESLITYGSRGLFRWPTRTESDGGADVLRVGPPELLREATPGKEWYRATWLPDHRTLAMIDDANARVLLVDTAHRHPALSRAPALSSGANRRMTSISVSPDGRWAAAGGWLEAGIPVWDLPLRRLVRVLPPADSGGDTSFRVTFSPDGRWLISCSNGPTAAGYYFWEVGTWKRGPFVTKQNFSGFSAPVFSPDGKLMAMGLSPERVRLAEPSTGRTIAHLSTLQPLHAGPLTFSPDGTRLFASTARGGAMVWDLRRVRAQLRAMDLDWDQPPYPPTSEVSGATVTLPAVRSIRVVGEVLEPSARRLADLAALDERLRSNPDDVDALIDRGWLRLRTSKRPESITDLERALTLRQDDPDAPILLAEAYLQTNDLTAAGTALDRHLARWADDLDARYQRGLIALGLGHFQAAAKDFTRGLQADPARTEIRYRRAQAWLRLGRFQDALTDIDMVIRSHPPYAPYYELRSETHESLGHHEQALADLKRAGEMPSADPAQANNLAWKLATGPAHLRDPKLALSLARTAIERTPGKAIYLNTLGVAQYVAGQYAEATTTLEKSLAAGNGQSDAFGLFFLAMAHHKLGQAAQARADFGRALLWRRDHQDLLGGQSSAELDGFQAEAQAMLDGPLPKLPADVFAPE